MHSPTASKASGIDQARGISLATADSPASKPITTSARESRREGRHSILPPNDSSGGWQGTDAIDKAGEFGIGRHVITHEPVPELIVLDFQQP